MWRKACECGCQILSLLSHFAVLTNFSMLLFYPLSILKTDIYYSNFLVSTPFGIYSPVSTANNSFFLSTTFLLFFVSSTGAIIHFSAFFFLLLVFLCQLIFVLYDFPRKTSIALHVHACAIVCLRMCFEYMRINIFLWQCP